SNSRARPVMRVLGEGLEAAALAVRATGGSLFIGQNADSLRCVAACGPDAKFVIEHGVPLNPRLARRALDRKTAFIVSSLTSDPQFSTHSSHETALALLAPLHNGDQSLGLVQLVNPKSPARFTARDTRIVAGLARYITTSLIQTSSLRRQEGLAAHDPLTGLRNVRELNRLLGRAVSSARRGDRDMALMFVDVDHLKRVNSKLGHAAGSEALKRTGRALYEAAAGVGDVFRFGGDEFIVVQKHASKESAHALADHLRSHVAASTGGPMRPAGRLPRITVSIGVSTLMGLRHLNGQPPRDLRARLMTTADRALFRAKAAGRNRVVLATSRDDRF
ncbi:MAG: GGDEF domain-containing protein, partial [Deltaproteobacteria bacterium]|nr:GGDEF domain-containing protein [Deltaproteobacteria bacterium]